MRTYVAFKPSPVGEGGPRQRWMRCLCAKQNGSSRDVFRFRSRNRRCSADEEKRMRNTSCSGRHAPYRNVQKTYIPQGDVCLPLQSDRCNNCGTDAHGDPSHGDKKASGIACFFVSGYAFSSFCTSSRPSRAVTASSPSRSAAAVSKLSGTVCPAARRRSRMTSARVILPSPLTSP